MVAPVQEAPDAGQGPRRPRRVLQLIGDLNRGGAENVVLSLTNGLQRRGWPMAVCGREHGVLIPEFVTGVGVHVIPKRSTVDTGHLQSLCALIRKLDIELIHSHLFGNDLYACAAAAITGRPLVCTVHGYDALQTPRRRMAYRFIGRIAKRIVTVSEPLYQQVLASKCAPRDRVAMIRNGIDFTPMTVAGDARRRVREGLGISPATKVIGAVGNIKPVKGYDVLIEAFADFQRQIPDSVLLIAGGVADPDVEHRSSLIALAGKLGLSDRVRFLGVRADVPELLKALDIYMLPSHSEGTSIALLEAMGSGVPVVATAVGGTPYLLADREMGLLVPAGKPTVMSDAMGAIIANESTASRMASKAKKHALETAGLDAMVTGYEALFQDVVDGRSAGPR
jgi:glycosyltransferase involved in cell wall biosynthesis